jgi:hypothetical protein
MTPAERQSIKDSMAIATYMMWACGGTVLGVLLGGGDFVTAARDLLSCLIASLIIVSVYAEGMTT